MKAILILITLILPYVSFSQSDETCEAIKSENMVLKSIIKNYGIDSESSNTEIISFSKDIKVNLIKCIGDKVNQNVTVYFNVINESLPHQSFSIASCVDLGINYERVKCQALDKIGNGYTAKGVTLASTQDNQDFSSCGLLMTKITSKLSTGNYPVAGSITFINVLPNISHLNQVDIPMYHSNLMGGDSKEQKGVTELKNVAIIWK